MAGLLRVRLANLNPPGQRPSAPDFTRKWLAPHYPAPRSIATAREWMPGIESIIRRWEFRHITLDFECWSSQCLLSWVRGAVSISITTDTSMVTMANLVRYAPKRWKAFLFDSHASPFAVASVSDHVIEATLKDTNSQ